MSSETSGVVARNKFQQKFIHNTQEHLAPDPFATQTAPCTILKVYDAETFQDEGVPIELGGLLDTHPGWLFALVQLRDNRSTMILPFKEPEEYIYFIHGNRVLLEGRPATICYVNQDPQNGCIVLQRNHNEIHLALGKMSKVHDIGRII